MKSQWISWFCSAPNHKYYAEIDEKFIEDPFNLSGLSSQVPLYKETLEVILNMEPNDAMYSRIPDLSLLQPSAELLYGLIHQRYIITKDGMLQMVTSRKRSYCLSINSSLLQLEKYKAGEFGKCPRFYCDGCHLLPCGQHDTPKQSNVRLYCPNCKDIYIPPNPKYAHIDGKNLIYIYIYIYIYTHLVLYNVYIFFIYQELTLVQHSLIYSFTPFLNVSEKSRLLSINQKYLDSVLVHCHRRDHVCNGLERFLIKN